MPGFHCKNRIEPCGYGTGLLGVLDFGTGTANFIDKPSWETAGGLCQGIATASGALAGGLSVGARLAGTSRVATAEAAGASRLPIKGYTRHGLTERAIGDPKLYGYEKHGVSPRAIPDAVKNPIETISQSGGRVNYVGKDAFVVLNQEGKVITTHPLNHHGWRY